MDVRFLDKKYQVVVLSSPYSLLSDPLVRSRFLDICNLKIEGYSKEYPEGVLPFDTTDFIANHVVLCEKSPEGLRPLMGFKSVDLATCDFHRVALPIFGMLKGGDVSPQHATYFEEMAASYRQKGRSAGLAYNGSFTVHPSARADKTFMSMMWDLGFFLTAGHYLTEGTDKVVAVCATKFKVDSKKLERGWTYCEAGGTQLNAYHAYGLFEAELIPMELTDIQTRCRSYFDPFALLWENRIIHRKDRQIAIAA